MKPLGFSTAVKSIDTVPQNLLGVWMCGYGCFSLYMWGTWLGHLNIHSQLGEILTYDAVGHLPCLITHI